MAIKVIVFDFDGTLIESNTLKYEAFFQLFPQDASHEKVIRDILARHPEESRYVILEKILRKIDPCGDRPEEQVEILAAHYNDIVLEGAKSCPECPGAERLLQRLSSLYPLYLSSTTPEDALCKILSFRRWTGYFKGIFGYPRKKLETLREIVKQERVKPSQVLVVGDGESDRVSAEKVGCSFFDVKEKPLLALRLQLGGC